MQANLTRSHFHRTLCIHCPSCCHIEYDNDDDDDDGAGGGGSSIAMQIQ